MQLTEIRIAGFGGQGVILWAIVLGRSASIHQGAFAELWTRGARRGLQRAAHPVKFAHPVPLRHQSGHPCRHVAGGRNPLCAGIKG